MLTDDADEGGCIRHAYPGMRLVKFVQMCSSRTVRRMHSHTRVSNFTLVLTMSGVSVSSYRHENMQDYMVRG